MTRDEALDRTEAAAARALQLDPGQAAAHTALGDAYRQRGDLEAAEREFRRAIELNPGYATAHHWLADLLMLRLEGEAALEEIRIAESLDPVAPAILSEKVQALMMLGRYDAATAQMDRTAQLHPDVPVVRGWAFLFAAMPDQWDRAAGHLSAQLRLAGLEDDVAERAAAALRDADRRDGLLRALAEGRIEAWGIPGAGGLQALGNPLIRFVAARKVLGEAVAMDYLQGVMDGPDAAAVYVPVLPALMGPVLARSPRGKALMAGSIGR